MTEALLATVLDCLTKAGVGVVVFGYRDGQFTRVAANAGAVGRLGYTPEEWIALPMFKTIPEDHRSRVSDLWSRLATGVALPPTIEIALSHRNGTAMRAEYIVGRYQLDDMIALVFVMRDVATHPQAHMSLLEADRLSLVGALSAGFAHEINNPLTSVVLNLRSLRKQVANGFTDPLLALRCVDDVTLAAERIASNVRALQTLATRTAGDAVDLAAVVTSALRLATPTLEPRAQVVRRIVAGVRASGEESRIGQAVLAMLLFSASGFAEAGGPHNEIVVVVERRGDQAVVEVSDNGRDVGTEEVEHAFDPFFRSSSRGAGVGVGLGIARSVASTLRGDVLLARRDGGGTVITMTLAPA